MSESLKSQYLALQSDFQDFAQSTGIIKKQLNASLNAMRKELDDSKAMNAETISKFEKQLEEKDKHIQLEKSLRVKEEEEKLEITKKFEKVQATLSSVQKDCATKQGELGKLQNNFDEYVNFLEKELAEKNELSQKEVSMRKTAEQDLAEMKETCKKMESSLSSLQKDFDQKNAELTKLQNSFDEYIKSSREAAEKLDVEMNETKEQLAKSLAANESSETTLESHILKLSTLEKHLEELNMQIKNESSSRLVLERERDEIQEKCKVAVSENAALMTKLDSYNMNVSSLEKELAEKNNIIESETALRHEMEKQQAEFIDRCDKAESLCATFQNDYEAKQVEIAKLQENFDNHLHTSRKVAEKVDSEKIETKKSLEEANAKNEALTSTLETTRKELMEKNEEIQRETSLRLKAEQAQRDMKQQCVKAEATLLSLISEYDAKKASFAILQSEFDDHVQLSLEEKKQTEAELTEEKNLLAEAIAESKVLKTELAELAPKLSSLQEELDDKSKQIQDENMRRMKCEEEQVELRKRCENAETSKVAIQELCDAKELELTKLQINYDQYVKASQDGQGDLDASLAVLKEQLNDATSENASLKAKLDMVTLKLEELEKDVEGKNEQLQNESSLRVKAEQEQIASEENGANVRASLSSLQKQLEKKEEDFKKLKLDLDEQIQSSRESTAKLDAELSERNTQLDEVISDKTILTTKLDRLEEECSNLQKELNEKIQEMQVETSLRLKARQENTEIEQQRSKAEEALESAQKSCDEKEIEITKLQAKLDEYDRNCNSDNSSLQKELEAKIKQIEIEAALRIKAEKEKTELKEQCTKTEESLSCLQKEYSEKDLKFKELLTKVENIDAEEKVDPELSKTKKRLEETKAENYDLTTELEKVTPELARLEKLLDEKNQQIEQEASLRQKAEQEVQEKNMLIQHESSLRLKAEEEHIKVKERYEEMSKAILTQNADKIARKQKGSYVSNGDSSAEVVDKVFTELTETNKKLEEATAENEALGVKMNSIHLKLTSLEKELDEKNQQIKHEIELRMKAEEASSVNSTCSEESSLYAPKECHLKEEVLDKQLTDASEKVSRLEKELEDKNRRLEQEVTLRKKLEKEQKKMRKEYDDKLESLSEVKSPTADSVDSSQSSMNLDKAVAKTNEKLAKERSIATKIVEEAQHDKKDHSKELKKMKEDMNVLKNLLLFRERELNETRVELAVRSACLEETRVILETTKSQQTSESPVKPESPTKPESPVDGTASIRSYTVNSSDESNSLTLEFNDKWPAFDKSKRNKDALANDDANGTLTRSKSSGELEGTGMSSSFDGSSSVLNFDEERWTPHPQLEDDFSSEHPYIYIPSPSEEKTDIQRLQEEIENLQKQYHLNESNGKKLENQLRAMKKEVSQSTNKKQNIQPPKLHNPFISVNASNDEKLDKPPIKTVVRKETRIKKKTQKFNRKENPFSAAGTNNDDDEADDPPVKMVVTKDIRTKMAEKLHRKERQGTLRREFTAKRLPSNIKVK